MNPSNPLMPRLQVGAAAVILLLFFVMAVGPMVGLKTADPSLIETEKAVILILVGFLFGTSVSGGKKDDANAALTAKITDIASAPTTTERQTP